MTINTDSADEAIRFLSDKLKEPDEPAALILEHADEPAPPRTRGRPKKEPPSANGQDAAPATLTVVPPDAGKVKLEALGVLQECWGRGPNAVALINGLLPQFGVVNFKEVSEDRAAELFAEVQKIKTQLDAPAKGKTAPGPF